ncbi:MAG: NAD(P)H-dependent oxidoreductase, partial [Gemmatimonadota bacterium]|nr:NAD(P)H-dependent oxidoreductase [Gemmatimonadota bacterium]
PVYNWACCSELKKFVEYIGSTPPGGSLRGAFYDKIVMFVNAGGLPHSYIAFASLATSLMLDFKCIISPYNVYVHNDNWVGEGELDDKRKARLYKSLDVLIELAERLQDRSYTSNWEI